MTNAKPWLPNPPANDELCRYVDSVIAWAASFGMVCIPQFFSVRPLVFNGEDIAAGSRLRYTIRGAWHDSPKDRTTTICTTFRLFDPEDPQAAAEMQAHEGARAIERAQFNIPQVEETK